VGSEGGYLWESNRAQAMQGEGTFAHAQA